MDMEDDFGLPERKSDNSTQSEEKGATEGKFECFLYNFFFFFTKTIRKRLAESFFLLKSPQALTKVRVNGMQNLAPVQKKWKN